MSVRPSVRPSQVVLIVKVRHSKYNNTNVSCLFIFFVKLIELKKRKGIWHDSNKVLAEIEPNANDTVCQKPQNSVSFLFQSVVESWNNLKIM